MNSLKVGEMVGGDGGDYRLVKICGVMELSQRCNTTRMRSL